MYSLEMIEEVLPVFLQDLFRSDGNTTPRVLPAVNRFVAWFDHSGLPFFKHYTDHSAQHSLDVYRTGIEIIANSSQRLISARDLGYFLISCFCHDAGMHLTEFHFVKLVDKGHLCKYAECASEPWPQIWQSFLEEARRFNSKTLNEIFGDTQPIQEPPSNITDYTDRHRRLIGEFLRRYHPRLAHELPLGLDAYLELGNLLEGFRDEEKDLIGFIAQSHGIPLRDTFEYVRQRFDLRDHNRTHIVYLMSLLRISDYLQLQSARAPRLKWQLHPVVSPISQREWRVHDSVKNITRTHNDPEAIYIDAQPSSASDYLRLKEWLEGLQRELDTCWAVFGEVYGRQTDNGLCDLKLCLRRVRSSIFEKKRSFAFLAEDVHFRVAEAEMLSLLLAPLYGDNPGYGIRELLQNAVDAIQERNFIEKSLSNSYLPKASVELIFKTDGSGVFTVEDNGLGMTAETLKMFFLNAVASFRNSISWRAAFVQRNGSTAIARNGRFGVGALAAFMIGDRIKLKTRHYTLESTDGLEFEAGLHDPQIEVRRTDLPIGTKIEIDFGKERRNLLTSFCAQAKSLFFFDPSLNVELRIIEEEKIKTQVLSREKGFQIASDEVKGYSKVGILSAATTYVPDVVNGIAITPLNKNSQVTKIASHGGPITPPWCASDAVNGFDRLQCSVHMEDRESSAPINLARVAFTSADKEIVKFIEDNIYKEIIFSIPFVFNREIKKPTTIFYKISSAAFIRLNNKICPCDAYIMNAAGIKALVHVYYIGKIGTESYEIIKSAARMSSESSQEYIAKTSLKFHLRKIDIQSRASLASIFVIKSILLNNLLNSCPLPKWLLALVDRIKTVNVGDIEFSIISWGSRRLNVEDELVNILNKGGVSHIEYFEASDWTFTSGWQKFPAQTGFSRRWMEQLKDKEYLLDLGIFKGSIE